jgi:hypothetical protein
MKELLQSSGHYMFDEMEHVWFFNTKTISKEKGKGIGSANIFCPTEACLSFPNN